AMIAVAGTLWIRHKPSALERPAILAVLPFENLDGEEYFADGMTEETITELARIQPRRLMVIAGTSVMPYRRTTKTVQQIGRELGVGYVLMGSVRRSEGKVRISVQLVGAADNRRVWAQIYERPLAEALAVQRELAQSVAAQMRLTFASEDRPRAAAARAVD